MNKLVCLLVLFLSFAAKAEQEIVHENDFRLEGAKFRKNNYEVYFTMGVDKDGDIVAQEGRFVDDDGIGILGIAHMILRRIYNEGGVISDERIQANSPPDKNRELWDKSTVAVRSILPRLIDHIASALEGDEKNMKEQEKRTIAKRIQEKATEEDIQNVRDVAKRYIDKFRRQRAGIIAIGNEIAKSKEALSLSQMEKLGKWLENAASERGYKLYVGGKGGEGGKEKSVSLVGDSPLLGGFFSGPFRLDEKQKGPRRLRGLPNLAGILQALPRNASDSCEGCTIHQPLGSRKEEDTH